MASIPTKQGRPLPAASDFDFDTATVPPKKPANPRAFSKKKFPAFDAVKRDAIRRTLTQE